MYIEIHRYNEMEQKVLYFKINNALNMDCLTELNQKFKGIYAIYKDDLCLYVGQTTNLASRSATHLRGKYQNATDIYFWNIENIGFSDFKEKPKQAQKNILDNCEKYLMAKLKPIDNIDIDMDFRLSKNKIPDLCIVNIIIKLNHRLKTLFVLNQRSAIINIIGANQLDLEGNLTVMDYCKIFDYFDWNDDYYNFNDALNPFEDNDRLIKGV